MSRHITRDMHRRLNKFCFQLMTQNVFNKLDWPTFRTQCRNFRGTTGGNKTHSNIETPLPSHILRISSYRSDRSRLILDLVCMPVPPPPSGHVYAMRLSWLQSWRKDKHNIYKNIQYITLPRIGHAFRKERKKNCSSFRKRVMCVWYMSTSWRLTSWQ
jgi:hypothetical protein